MKDAIHAEGVITIILKKDNREVGRKIVKNTVVDSGFENLTNALLDATAKTQIGQIHIGIGGVNGNGTTIKLPDPDQTHLYHELTIRGQAFVTPTLTAYHLIDPNFYGVRSQISISSADVDYPPDIEDQHINEMLLATTEGKTISIATFANIPFANSSNLTITFNWDIKLK